MLYPLVLVACDGEAVVPLTEMIYLCDDIDTQALIEKAQNADYEINAAAEFYDEENDDYGDNSDPEYYDEWDRPEIEDVKNKKKKNDNRIKEKTERLRSVVKVQIKHALPSVNKLKQ